MTNKQTAIEKEQAIDTLKKHIHEGDTIFTIQRHRSASGMYRAIDCYVFQITGKCDNCQSDSPREQFCGLCSKSLGVLKVVKLRYTWSIATALGYRYDKKHEAIGVGGCGFDAAHDIVYNLSRVLFGAGDKLHKEEI